jgi:hypothetical protein
MKKPLASMNRIFGALLMVAIFGLVLTWAGVDDAAQYFGT